MDYRFLQQIDSPADLRRLRPGQLPEVAGEVRQCILEAVSQTGGHLGASLGAVELTLALHYVFNTPHDRIVWDVGHQTYAHKILTGRRDRLSSLRQPAGLAGFTCRQESEYDCFGAGHASTSISSALGIAEARRLLGERGKTIAVIGDAGISGGLALEGLNQAGSRERDLIVILNDNEMSISPNVGALSYWFSRKFTHEAFLQMRKRLKLLLTHIPHYGKDVIHLLRRAIDSSKAFLTPGILFEGLGFQYVGPLDGHDLKSLVDVLQRVKRMDGPVLVHAVTQKGRGYAPAEKDPHTYHGVNPFDLESGKSPKPAPGPVTFTAAFGQALVELAEQNPRVVAITAAMCSGTGLDKFAKTFPDRFFDVGIAEGHAVTFAAGLATEGIRPVCAIYSTFLQRAYDSIIHDVCLQNLPVTFVHSTIVTRIVAPGICLPKIC